MTDDAPYLAPGRVAVAAPPADTLTRVELTWVENKIEYWIRFGRIIDEQILDRRRCVVAFRPGSVFAFVRWAANDYGTVFSRVDVVQAVEPGQAHQTLPFVRPGGVGAIGHSLGGHNAVYTAVFDERIAAVVSSCGLDLYTDYYDGNPQVWQPEKGWCQLRYMPRLLDYAGRLDAIPFDFAEMIGALAPRPCFISAPLRDSNFRWASVDRIAAAARPVYRLLGAPDGLTVIHPDADHDFPDEARQQAYALLTRALA